MKGGKKKGRRMRGKEEVGKEGGKEKEERKEN